MERKLGVTEAREKFAEVVDKVQHQGEAFIISRHGKPAVAVVPIEVYENWKKQRREFFNWVREIQARADLEPEEAERLAAQAVAAARGQTQ